MQLNQKTNSMKAKVTIGIILLSVMMFSACNTLKVVVDYDKSVDFSKFTTFEYYGWAEESDEILNPFNKKRIESAFGKEFSKRGMKLVEEGGDLIVTLYIVTKEKTSYSATSTSMGMYGGGYGGYYGYGPRYGWGPGHGMGTSYTSYNEYDYTVGTLIIDIYDAKKEQLIWESIGSRTLNQDQTSEAKEQSIKKTANNMMSKYPVKPLKNK